MSRPMPTLLLRPGIFLGLACCWWGVADSRATSSPFLPAGTADSAQAAEDSGCELVGVISTSKQTLVGINEKTVHKSLWIPVGKSMEGVEVISCDSHQDTAVVKIGGQTRTLVMRSTPTITKPASQMVVSNAPPVISAVTLPVNPVTPAPTGPVTEQVQKETEARMLVSDLMEIGMQQRKAYEEAQHNANAQKAQ